MPQVPDAQLDGGFVAGLKAAADGRREVMLGLANGVMICQNTTICWWNGGNILHAFLEDLPKAGVKNFLLAVLDDETERYVARHFPHVHRFRPKRAAIPASQKNSHPANAVSTLKYALLKQALSLGYHVLVTDLDLVYVQNPFDHLHRDADIEAQTDGFTREWAVHADVHPERRVPVRARDAAVRRADAARRGAADEGAGVGPAGVQRGALIPRARRPR